MQKLFAILDTAKASVDAQKKKFMFSRRSRASARHPAVADAKMARGLFP